VKLISSPYRSRAILGGALIIIALVCGGVAVVRPGETVAMATSLRSALGAGWLSMTLFLLAQTVIALSGVLPASLLGTAAGAVFGIKMGFALASTSTLLGAQLSFLASRSLLRDFVARVLGARPRARALDALIAHEGLRFVCLLRLSPIMPFAMTSFALGMTSIGGRDYAIGTLAALPALFGYVLIGAFAGDGLDAWSTHAGPYRIVMLALGALATLALTLQLAAVVRKVIASPPQRDLFTPRR
jgi:uncharacterized membrane protein YdjX (TVP38/TMEM64 family)